MGCDIHTFVERYNKETNQWEILNLYKKNSDNTYEPIPVYDGRDYELFGLLAGVRGSSHFFSGGYGYIVEPRGIPNDLSQYVQSKWECGKDEDGRQWWHTPTWYDFCELDTYAYLLKDFNKIIKEKNKTIRLLEEEIDKLNMKNGDEEDYELLEWYPDDEEDDEYNVFDRFESFVNCIRDVLDAYRIWYPKPSEIRVVMWFDS